MHCERCGNLLLAFETRGTVCNACLARDAARVTYEVFDIASSLSHGTYDTLDEARGCVAFDRLPDWAIYSSTGDCVASSPLVRILARGWRTR